MLPCMNILQWIDVHECKQGFLAFNKDYSTCILFLPSEVTKELVKTIVDMKLMSQSTTTTMHVTSSNTQHPPHILSHACLNRSSTKEQGNNMHLITHQEHDKGLTSHKSSNKIRIHHIRST
jgi:hypothetical protein